MLPPTVIIRHRKENLKKCSLRGLEDRSDLRFLTYPITSVPQLNNYFLLSFDGPLLSKEDCHSGLIVLDGTWRYAKKMAENLPFLASLPKRRLPKSIRTAYPRKQSDCPNPERGLASIEAIFVAHLLLGRNVEGLLENYYWKKEFLSGLGIMKKIC
ncbi:MAG: hypothetical protein KR126chlam2_00089 [Chlamydiae bacterium]|nr:hypothetical protein [Chlamydiota bacterium]